MSFYIRYNLVLLRKNMSHRVPLEQFEFLVDQLALQGYAILPNFMPNDFVFQLAQRAKQFQKTGALRVANVGKHMQLNDAIRSDSTYWLDDNSPNVAEQDYFAIMNTVKSQVNRALYLGLDTLESHFAIYSIGSFYKTHLDQFKTDIYKNDDLRKLSCIIYLNEDWRPDDGGELRFYSDFERGQFVDICPQGGTLVAFLSEQFYHEVLPAKRERISLTGWFKTRANSSL